MSDFDWNAHPIVGAADAPQGGAGFSWDDHPIVRTGARIAIAPVQGGTVGHVDLITPRAYGLTVAHGAVPQYTLAVRYKSPLTAPIAKGAEVASLIVRAPGQPIARLPLVAGADVGTGGVIDRLRDGFAGMTRP